jgi:hypothetical protein
MRGVFVSGQVVVVRPLSNQRQALHGQLRDICSASLFRALFLRISKSNIRYRIPVGVNWRKYIFRKQIFPF